MASGSILLYIKGMLAEERFAIYKNYPPWEGQSFFGEASDGRALRIQKIKKCS